MAMTTEPQREEKGNEDGPGFNFDADAGPKRIGRESNELRLGEGGAPRPRPTILD